MCTPSQQIPSLMAVVAALCLAALPASTDAAGNVALGQQKAAACMACHGADGNSIALPAPAEPWPRLAGQVPEYIIKQVTDFKAGRRTNEQMSPQADAVLLVDVPDIAAFFAAQKETKDEGSVAADQLALGAKLFNQGKGRPQVVPACKGCHGASGAGNPNWREFMSVQPALLAPAIGSQHANYLVKQLKAYRDGSRSNDPAQVMRNIAARLSDQEIDAVAGYAARLTR